MIRYPASLALLLVAVFSASAADWPQFLGPNRDGSTPEKVSAWKGNLKAAWKAPIGDGHSSPVVADGIVYAFFQPKNKDADALAAFDAKTGKVKWEKSYERAKFNPPFGKGPRSTPCVDSGKVYTLGNTGILACWDARTGAIDWKVDTLKQFDTRNLFFGVSTSPLVVEDMVVVMVGGKGAGIVAFDKATGKVKWQATSDGASYASAIASGKGADRQIITLTASNLRGLSPDGKELWKFPFTAEVGKLKIIESSTTPIRVGDLVVGGSVTDGSIGLKVTSQGGEWSARRAWFNPTLTCYFSTPVVVGKHLYMVNGKASITSPSITLRCVEAATGKALWEQPKVGRYHAAIIRAGNNTLLMLDDNGYLTLFQPDAKGFKPLAKSRVCGPTWAHPALVDGRVYLRDEKELMCVPLQGSEK